MRACARGISDTPIKQYEYLIQQYEYHNFYSEHRNKKYDWQIFHSASRRILLFFHILCIHPIQRTVIKPNLNNGPTSMYNLTRGTFTYKLDPPCLR